MRYIPGASDRGHVRRLLYSVDHLPMSVVLQVIQQSILTSSVRPLVTGGNANMNIYDILYRFGQIPVGVRSYVGSMLATPSSSCSAGSGGDFIVFNGDCAESVYNHEA